MTAGVTFTRLSNLQLSLVYAKFLGSPNPVTRPLADRDYVLATATYSTSERPGRSSFSTMRIDMKRFHLPSCARR